jgi:hypothetical protein
LEKVYKDVGRLWNVSNMSNVEFWTLTQGGTVEVVQRGGVVKELVGY